MRQYGDKHLVISDAISMVDSGTLGAPMLSRFGQDTIVGNMCFMPPRQGMDEYKFDHNFGNFDITRVTTEVIREKIKADLLGNDSNVI
jgi:hypothetical protein